MKLERGTVEMPRNPISPFDRVRMVTLRQQGLSVRDVAREVGRSHSDVVRTWNRYQATGDVSDLQRTGRPRATAAADDRYLLVMARRNRFENATELRRSLLEATGADVSTQTIRNRLHDSQLRARRLWRGPALTPHHRAARYAWARAHEMWDMESWSRVLFSDEVRICLSPDNNRQRVWRESGDAERLRYAAGHVQQGGGSVMFWGGIMNGHRTPLVPIQGAMRALLYRDTILEPIVEPLHQNFGDGFVFQDDNARPHRAGLVNEYLEEVGIERLDWPALSPDMNAIEHAWDQLKRAVRSRRNPPRTVGDLRVAAVEEWENLEQQSLNNLVNSMPRRVRALRLARGGITRY